MTGRVRHAAVGDAERLAVVHAQVWRETYAGVMPEDVLARMDALSHVERWRERVTKPPVFADVPFRLLVGVEGGDVVAFAAAGRRSDDEGPQPLQLYAINVLRSHLGTGLGQELLDAAIGRTPAYLWVAAGNDRATAFYSRNGFRLDGAAQTDEGHGGVQELRMQRP